MRDDPTHDWSVVGGSCRPGCLLMASEKAVAGRARKYGIAPSDLATLIGVTAGICMVCRRCHATIVEHCHQTRRVRGLICADCNARIGHLEGNQYWPPVYAGSCVCARARSEDVDRWRRWWLEQSTYRFLEHAMDFPSHQRRAAFAALVADPYPPGDPSDLADKRRPPLLRDNREGREVERLLWDAAFITDRATRGPRPEVHGWERRSRQMLAAQVRASYSP